MLSRLNDCYCCCECGVAATVEVASDPTTVVAELVPLGASTPAVMVVEIEVVVIELLRAVAAHVAVVEVEVGEERPEAGFGLILIRVLTVKLGNWSTRKSKPTKPNCRANVECGLRPGIAPRTANLQAAAKRHPASDLGT
jgi:hypothetical protein